MRIIAGTLRGRKIEAPPGDAVRPTSDRAREALFNMLAHGQTRCDGTPILSGAVVLDAFCGSGALALEALSRGAAQATLLDRDSGALAAARRNARALGLEGQVSYVLADAADPPPSRTRHDLVFLDPPYDSDEAEAALTVLARGGWIAPGALVVVERPSKRSELAPPEGFAERERRRYGAATLIFLSFDPDAAA